MSSSHSEDPARGSGTPEPSSTHTSPADRSAASFTSAGLARVGSREAEGLYRLLVASVRDYAIFAMDPKGHILSWNDGAQRIKGYAPNEIIGRHFSIFYPRPRVEEGFPEYELEIAAREGRFEDEGWRIRKDGTRFWANVIITALRDESGELVGFAKVTRDLTERRKAERALQQSEARFRLLVSGVRDYAIFMLDPDGLVVSWNSGAERINGYRSEEIIGQHFSVFYPAQKVAENFPQHELEVAAREGRFEDEGWRIRKDGSQFWANVVITALRDADGRLLGFGKVTRDLTERRQAEERRLADARRIAAVEAANKAKSEFLASMSHELRTPLNAIGGYAELLNDEVYGSINEQQRDALTRLHRSQQHLLMIIEDLLSYSLIESGRVRFNIQPVPAAEVLNGVQVIMEPQASRRGVRLLAKNCPATVMTLADRARAEQILLNLVSNALKFSPPDGEVTVTCARENGRVTFTVKDQGPGIPEEKHEEIFEPFVQVGRALNAPHEGTGLGLAISRDLARGMNGQLKVESKSGQGAKFTLELPAG